MLFPSVRMGALMCVTLGALAAPVLAQMPYPPPAASCICLRQAMDAANAAMGANNAALGTARAQLDQIDQQLTALRAQLDVNNPQAVAQFRQLLEQRDIAAKRAGGPALTDSQAATANYNNAVAAYNNQCAGRPLPPPPPAPIACPMP
jgi:ABC-type transporter Mla subunit MlaD